ncbi:transglycosylase domain-containing protein [Deinococcus lacus]|uniref:peptidoglycan glycosyltransferase n=1 Tax=Deinococcus lacus TaxID=392561 RepID=A0ABW1YBT0_9DEIO
MRSSAATRHLRGSLLVVLAAGLLLLALALLGLWWMWGRDLPSVDDLDVLALGGETRVYDRKGRLIGTLTPSLGSGETVNRDLLELGEISQPLWKAVVTSEDRRFYQHSGVDWRGIARGLFKGIFQRDLEGGSSITQQVVKNTLLQDMNQARTLERKFREAILAYRVERKFSKPQILSAYLNVIYWGHTGQQNIVGIGAASQAYFKKPASELNLAESVYLATLIPAPGKRYKQFAEYRPLARDLLERMVEDGRVTRAQAEEAWRTPIYPAGWRIGWNADGTVRRAVLERPDRLRENLPRQAERPAFHYLQAVERELGAKIGRKAMYSSAKIITGMDLEAQAAAEAASLRAEVPPGATLGMAFVEPGTGEVMALVGQKLAGGRPADWDNASQARRQVGSSIKPLLYTLALSEGWKQSDTVLDAPLEGDYQPQNYSGRWLGYPVTLRYALDHSLNLPTVRLAREIGLGLFEAKLRELGFTVPDNLGLSLSIGTLEASPLQMAAAYASFVNGGLYIEPTFVRRVVGRDGKEVYARPAPKSRRVWDEQTAWLGLDMLRGVVDDLSPAQGGLATRARIEGWPVGGKTGTTNDVKDLWFVGVTPLMSGAVWVGREDSAPLPAWAYSGEVAAPIWQRAAAGMLAGRPAAEFREPEGIEYAVVRRVNMAFRAGEADEPGVFREGQGRSGEAAAPAPSQPSAPPQPQALPTPAAPTAESVPALPEAEDVPVEPPAPLPSEESSETPPAWLPPLDPAAAQQAAEELRRRTEDIQRETAQRLEDIQRQAEQGLTLPDLGLPAQKPDPDWLEQQLQPEVPDPEAAPAFSW